MKNLALGIVALAALSIGIYLGQPDRTGAEVEIRPDWQLADQHGELRNAAEFDGRWQLINFWATWCTPCIAEIPILIATQARHDPSQLQILGPAFDRLEPAQAFAERAGINYPVLFGEMAISRWMNELGENRGALPFSVLINPNGQIQARHWGQLDEATLEDWLAGVPRLSH